MNQLPVTHHCLWISNDPSGKSWSGPQYATSGADFACEEWDAAELEYGDLLNQLRRSTCPIFTAVLGVVHNHCVC